MQPTDIRNPDYFHHIVDCDPPTVTGVVGHAVRGCGGWRGDGHHRGYGIGRREGDGQCLGSGIVGGILGGAGGTLIYVELLSLYEQALPGLMKITAAQKMVSVVKRAADSIDDAQHRAEFLSFPKVSRGLALLSP